MSRTSRRIRLVSGVECAKTNSAWGAIARAIALSLAIAALLASCSSNEGSIDKLMPNVAGQRLDVARSNLNKVGLNDRDAIEIVGGGAQGTIDESAWTVCDQDPAEGAALDAVRLLIDRSCGAEDKFDATPSTEAPVDSSPIATPTPTESLLIVVPNVVGMDLQEAQDLLQAEGLYVLTSHDAKREGRNQIIDNNWKVCDQEPAAGTKVPESQEIDLGAVKDEEQCP